MRRCRSMRALKHDRNRQRPRGRAAARQSLAACAKRDYTGGMAMRRAWKKIRYRLEWLALKFATKFLPLLSRKACYRLALWLASLGAMLDRRGRRVGLSKHISESCRS